MRNNRHCLIQYRWIRCLVFAREASNEGFRARDDSSSKLLFVFYLSNGGRSRPSQKKKKFGRERRRELTNSKSFVCSVFLSWTFDVERRERKGKGEAREDLWTGSTPMHLPTPFASSCSLVAGNYRRGNFWYVSNDGKGSLLDLHAFFLPFLFFSLFFFARDRVIRSR